MDLDEDRLGLLLVRVSELRSKIANCVARESSVAGDGRSRGQFEANGDDECSSPAVDGDDGAETLLAICEAFDSLESQLSSLQALQQQQEYQRADAIAEIERSRKRLLKKLTEYDGEHLDVVKEASAFASLKVDHNNELLLPPYPSHTPGSLALDNGHLPLLSYGRKSPENGYSGVGVRKGPKSEIDEAERVKHQSILSRSWGGLKFLVNSAVKTTVTLVAVASVLSLAGVEPRLVKKGTNAKVLSMHQPKDTEERRVPSLCPPGRVAAFEDGEIQCLVKERVEIPFGSVDSKPDVDYGCG